MKAKKEKNYFIFENNRGKVLTYNTNTSEFSINGVVKASTTVKPFFAKTNAGEIIESIVCDSKAAKELLADCWQEYRAEQHNVSNVATVLELYSSCAQLEQYYSQGLRMMPSANTYRNSRNLQYLQDHKLSKAMREFVKYSRYYNCRSLDSIISHIEMRMSVLAIEVVEVVYRDYDIDVFKMFVKLFHEWKTRDLFAYMTNNFNAGYVATKFYKYMFEECISTNDLADTLIDVFNTQNKLPGRKLHLAKNLLTYHDILLYNFKLNADTIISGQVEDTCKMYTHLEDEKDDKFIIKIPTSSMDLIEEGNSLHHCVGSYVERIAANETFVMFMRKKEEPEKSLYTIEVRGGNIVQMRGRYNEMNFSESETTFIKSYTKRHKLQLSVRI